MGSLLILLDSTRIKNKNPDEIGQTARKFGAFTSAASEGNTLNSKDEVLPGTNVYLTARRIPGLKVLYKLIFGVKSCRKAKKTKILSKQRCTNFLEMIDMSRNLAVILLMLRSLRSKKRRWIPLAWTTSPGDKSRVTDDLNKPLEDSMEVFCWRNCC